MNCPHRRNTRRAGLATALTAAVIALGACAHHEVTPSQWQGPQAALETLAARANAVNTVSAACGLTLASGNGDAVNLDGALAARITDTGQVWLRLRTWKIAQAVFDITVTPDGVWLVSSDEAAKRRPGGMGLSPEQIAKGWSLFMGGFFAEPGLELIDHGGSTFEVRRRDGEGVTMIAQVHRDTLNPIKYRIIDAKGTLRQTLLLSRYREVEPGLWWPLRIEAIGPDGRIEVRMEDVEVNTVLEDAVFTPPRRAVKQPAAAVPEP